MKSWPVQDAKAKFSELLETCINDGPQVITRRGEEAAVIVSARDWRNADSKKIPTLQEFLLNHSRGEEIPLPSKERFRWRKPPDLE